jgi:hypothetical protein
MKQREMAKKDNRREPENNPEHGRMPRRKVCKNNTPGVLGGFLFQLFSCCYLGPDKPDVIFL